MKNNIMAIAAQSAFFLSITFSGISQLNGDMAKLTSRESELTYISASAANSVRNSKVSSKALKNFSANFKNVANANWFVTESGEFLASFGDDNVKTTVYYDGAGRYDGLIKRYGEKQLPQDVRHMLKSVYYDYNVEGVDEVQARQTTVYIIYIRNESSAKTIRIDDEGMQCTIDVKIP